MKNMYTLNLRITISLVLIFGSILSFAQPSRLEGNFGAGWSNYDLIDRGVVKAVALQASATNFNATFLFNNANGNYDPQWTGSNTPHVYRPVDSLLSGQAFYYSSGGWNQNLETSIESGKYYTFIIYGLDPASTSNRNMSILQTTFLPVSINAVTQNPATPVTGGETVDVTLTLSMAKNADEKVFLRYTTDSWATSNFIEITSFDGSHQGIATIPAQINGTNVQYYALTTTRSNPDESTIDYYSLNINNNNNINYEYDVVGGLSAPEITLSYDGNITEGAENSEIITVTLTNDTFVTTLNSAFWTISNLPIGVSVDTIIRVNDTTATITLSGNSSIDYDSDITNFTVEISNEELEITATGTIVANTGVTFTAIVEATPSIALSFDGTITEGAENGEVITVTLTNDVFEASLNATNWIILNLPTSVSVDTIIRLTNTTASITLQGNSSLDYDTDITNLSVEITHDELVTLSTGSILANSGVTFTALVESDLIWLHMLTVDTLVQTLGDNAAYWINAEIGQASWNASQIGYGTTNVDTTAWNWFDAAWYADGSGSNKQVHSNIAVPQVIGTYYYVARAKALETDLWSYGNNDTWTNTTTFAPEYQFVVNEIPAVTLSSATAVDSSSIELSWTSDVTYSTVMVVKSSIASITNPTNGTTYTVGLACNEGEVIYKGTGTNFTHSGLNANTQVYYHFYTVNNDYYSDVVSSNATTTNEAAPSIALSFDGTITEGAENGEIITVTLTNDVFEASLNAANWTVSNLPTGVSVDTIIRLTNTTASITLSGNASLDYDSDITNFTVEISHAELLTMSIGSVIANSGVSFTAIIEDAGIWLHMLSYENYEQVVGDNASYWINAEIGQDTWDVSQIGYGISNSDDTDWVWEDATWYEDGLGLNKRVHANISAPNAIGKYYYIARSKADSTDEWHYANDTVWANNPVFAPQYFINVDSIPAPTACSALTSSSSQINLSWNNDNIYQNVIVLAKSGSDISATLSNETVYSQNDIIGDATVIYKGSLEAYNHIGLTASTQYFYDFYTVNNNFYSFIETSTKANATTSDGSECNLVLDLGEDTSICGGGAILINPALTVSPYGDSLVITFDASYGSGTLIGVSKVYMHSGAELTNSGSWDYPIGNWGQDDGIGLMENIGTDLWQITIHPQSYYSFPDDSIATGIYLVLRNAAGNITAKDNLGEDIYVDLTQSTPISSYGSISTTEILSPIASIAWSTGASSQTLTVTSSGSYFATITDQLGCTANDTINIEMGNIPLVDIGNDQVLCNGESIYLVADIGFVSYIWSNSSSNDSLFVTTAGNYSVTVTNEDGCTGFDFVNITENETPIANFDYVADGMEVTFNDLSLFAESYAWDFDGNGSTDYSDSTGVSKTYYFTGQYNVTLTVTNDCGTDSHTELVVITSVNSLEKTNNFDVFPNPVNNYLTIKTKNQDSKNIRILNILGETIFNSKTNESIFNIDFSNLAKGIYVVEIESDNQIQKQRIIKN